MNILMFYSDKELEKVHNEFFKNQENLNLSICSNTKEFQENFKVFKPNVIIFDYRFNKTLGSVLTKLNDFLIKNYPKTKRIFLCPEHEEGSFRLWQSSSWDADAYFPIDIEPSFIFKILKTMMSLKKETEHPA